jgi:hypothetical protein
MKLTRSRLNKIIHCKVQTKKRHSNNIRTNSDTNINTKKRKSKYFNLRNNTVKNWIQK